MNVSLKAVSAAVLLALGSASAFAASNDGVTVGKGAGTGAGDLVFAYEAVGGQASIVWDLAIFSGASVTDDLTWTSILSSPARNGFSITNTAVSSFLAANPGGRWNIFALTNTKVSGTGSSLKYDKAGYGLTINGTPDAAPATANNGAKLESLMLNNAAWIQAANEGGIADNGTLVAGPADAFQFNAGGTHSNLIAAQNATGLVGETLGYWTILIDNTSTRGLSPSPTNAQGKLPTIAAVKNDAGQAMGFTLAANGALTYGQVQPVPVPAAVWLMGSAVAGLAGIRRRKV